MPYKKGSIPWNKGIGLGKKENNKLYRQSHKDKGLCVSCNAPAVKGKVSCIHHLKLNRDRVNEVVKQRKEKGTCVYCDQPVANGSVYCMLHQSKRLIWDRNYRKKPESKMVDKKYRDERYYKLKAENKCVYCGMPLNEESRMAIYCVTCYSKKHGYF